MSLLTSFVSSFQLLSMEKKGFQRLDVNMKHSKQKKREEEMTVPFLFEDNELPEDEIKEPEIPKISSENAMYKQISKAISTGASDAIIRDIIFNQPIFKNKGQASRKNPTIGSLVASWTFKSLSRRANPTGQTDLDRLWTELSNQINENTFSKGSYNDVPPKLKELILFGKIPPQ